MPCGDLTVTTRARGIRTALRSVETSLSSLMPRFDFRLSRKPVCMEWFSLTPAIYIPRVKILNSITCGKAPAAEFAGCRPWGRFDWSMVISSIPNPLTRKPGAGNFPWPPPFRQAGELWPTRDVSLYAN